MAVMGPRPMETVGNCQESGISQGCGYEERPLPSTSRRKLSSCSSVRRPSRKERAYIPGELWPWKYTRSPGLSPSLTRKKWLKPTSYSVAAEEKEARCAHMSSSLWLALTTLALAFQRIKERMLRSIYASPGL